MANRCTLHKTQLEEFKRFLDGKGIAHRLGKGGYEVLQVMTISSGFGCIYERIKMPEHFTVQDKLESIIIGFYSEKRQGLKNSNDRDGEMMSSIKDVLSTVPVDPNGNDLTADWLFLAIKNGKVKHVSIN